jgi:glutamine cyclotransferase
VTVVDDELIQVTGREQKALIYGTEDLRFRRDVPIRGAAWGIANGGGALAQSDGTCGSKMPFDSADMTSWASRCEPWSCKAQRWLRA